MRSISFVQDLLPAIHSLSTSVSLGSNKTGSNKDVALLIKWHYFPLLRGTEWGYVYSVIRAEAVG